MHIFKSFFFIFILFVTSFYFSGLLALGITALNVEVYIVLLGLLLLLSPLFLLLEYFFEKKVFFLLSILVLLYLDLSLGLNNVGYYLVDHLAFLNDRIVLRRVVVILIILTSFLFIYKAISALGDHSNSIISVFIVFNILSSLVLLYSSSLFSDDEFDRVTKKKESDKPVIVHILLDELMSPDAIPRNIEESKKFIEEVNILQKEHGFLIYNKVYSRHSMTKRSLPAMLNYDSTSVYSKEGSYNGFSVHNKYFSQYALKGYDITLFSSQYTKYCNGQWDGIISHCYTLGMYNPFNKYMMKTENFRLQNIKYLFHATLQSFLNIKDSYFVNYLNKILKNRISNLSNLDSQMFPKWFDAISQYILSTDRGSMIYAHILSPHAPYVLDENCLTNDLPNEIIVSKTSKKVDFIQGEARKLMYRKYLRQATCSLRKVSELLSLMKKEKKFDDAIVIVHGDHGSRIMSSSDGGLKEDVSFLGLKDVTRENMIDMYPTFFAIRSNNIKAATDNTFVSLQSLFSAYAKKYPIDVRSENMDLSREVIIELGDNNYDSSFKQFKQFKMPNF